MFLCSLTKLRARIMAVLAHNVFVAVAVAVVVVARLRARETPGNEQWYVRRGYIFTISDKIRLFQHHFVRRPPNNLKRNRMKVFCDSFCCCCARHILAILANAAKIVLFLFVARRSLWHNHLAGVVVDALARFPFPFSAKQKLLARKVWVVCSIMFAASDDYSVVLFEVGR